MSYKESLKVEKIADVQPVNVIEKEEGSAEDDYELKRREKGKDVMEESLPNMVDDRVKELTKTQVPIYDDFPIWLTLKIKFKGLYASNIPCRTSPIRPTDQDDHHDDAHLEGENSAKRQKTSEHGTYVFGESSSCQVNESELGPSTSGNQEQLDDLDFWTDTYATDDDDELPAEKVSQELVEEMSKTVDEAKLRKVPTPVVQSCQTDPKAPALSLVNQDLLYQKKGNLEPKKIVLYLKKFPAFVFPDDDIEERTSRWVNKCVKKFNPYARYNVEHWKNPHAKIFYIKRQKELGKPKDEVYLNSKIVQVIKTTDYKNLNKNDIEDMYLLCINGKVGDYAETGLLWSLLVFIKSTVIWERLHDFQLGVESFQQKVNLTAPTITFPGIEKHKMFSIISEPVYGIIYKNIKKEKRVMRHQKIHKFCNATLKRVLEGLKSYNNDVKHGYLTPSLSKEDDEYLQLFEEEFEERLKHRDQMRCWEMYVNGIPLGSRRKRPE
ncbi:hypothetical protein Tco_0932859 [Tanacetum coccineum]